MNSPRRRKCVLTSCPIEGISIAPIVGFTAQLQAGLLETVGAARDCELCTNCVL